MYNLSVILKKYSVPVLFLAAGITLLIVGAMNQQNMWFMFASIMMLAAGALSLLFSSGELKRTFFFIFGAVAGIAAVITLGLAWKSVDDTSTYINEYNYCKVEAKQNLEDIRFIQKAYKEKNGKYLTSWDALVDFVENGKIDRLVQQGLVPARRINPEELKFLYNDNRAVDNDMTEEEAIRLAAWEDNPYAADFNGFVRDTLEVSILSEKFKNPAYVQSRIKSKLPAFNAKNLRFIPLTENVEWTLETKDSVAVSADVKTMTLKISGFIPRAKTQGKDGDKEEMFFGSLSQDDLSGSWEIE